MYCTYVCIMCCKFVLVHVLYVCMILYTNNVTFLQDCVVICCRHPQLAAHSIVGVRFMHRFIQY